MATEKLQEQEIEAEAPIHGDILEAIFSHVPLIHLVAACHVSKAWKSAVSSTLAHVKPVKPWLTVHTQCNRAPHVTTSHAYDPRSHVWVEIQHQPSIKHASALRSSHSTLLYTLSPTQFTFSFDPLHLTWHRARAPRVWRTDPVVSMVRRRIVVAGGTCGFQYDNDTLAVEMYDLETNDWVACQPMPALLKDSTASTWLSVAVDGERMHVTEKNSGVTYSFDPATKTWQGPYDLRPDQNVYYCVTGTLRDRLIVLGLMGDAENVRGVKLWQLSGEIGSDSGSEYCCEEMGEMPEEMVERLKGDGDSAVATVVMTTIGDCAYVHNPSAPEEMVVCEVVNGTASCQWGSLRNAVVNDATRLQRLVVSGGDVCLEDLQRAASENARFSVKEM